MIVAIEYLTIKADITWHKVPGTGLTPLYMLIHLIRLTIL